MTREEIKEFLERTYDCKVTKLNIRDSNLFVTNPNELGYEVSMNISMIVSQPVKQIESTLTL